MSTAEETEFPYFIADLADFLYFYPQYVSSILTILFSERNEKNLSGAFKSISQTLTNFLLSSAENTKIEPFLTF